jgi:hypothetical protein
LIVDAASDGIAAYGSFTDRLIGCSLGGSGAAAAGL